jgi:hypothetical protein
MDSVKLFDDWWDSAGAGVDRDWFRAHIRAAWIAGYNTPRSDNAQVAEINLALLDEVKSLQADANKRGTPYRRIAYRPRKTTQSQHNIT